MRSTGATDDGPVQATVGDHRPATRAALFGRLEDEGHGPGQSAILPREVRQDPRGTDQDRGVTVVAAGVHGAGMGRSPVNTAGLLDRQRIHVGSQSDRVLAGALEMTEPPRCPSRGHP